MNIDESSFQDFNLQFQFRALLLSLMSSWWVIQDLSRPHPPTSFLINQSRLHFYCSQEVCSSHFKFFTENKLLFKKSKNYLKKRKMAGKARKSTHKKKASTNAFARRRSSKPAAPKKRVEIDETVSNILTPGAQNFHRNPRGTNGVSDAISI